MEEMGREMPIIIIITMVTGLGEVLPGVITIIIER